MDKNSIIGLVLIGVLLLGYTLFSRPSAKERAEMERKRDSIVQVQKHIKDSLDQVAMQQASRQTSENAVNVPDSLKDELMNDAEKLKKYQDSIQMLERKYKYGVLADAATGTSEIIQLENNKMIVCFDTKGGKIHSVELKDYKTHDGSPLIMFQDSASVDFGYEMLVDNRAINTNDMYFQYMGDKKSITVAQSDSASVTFRLYAGADNYIEFYYGLADEAWMLDYQVRFVNMNEIVAGNVNYFRLLWTTKLPQLEKGRKWETQNTTINYCFEDKSVEKLNERKDEVSEESSANVSWVAFKQQFFSSILVTEEAFEEPVFSSKVIDEGKYIKELHTELVLPYMHEREKVYDMGFYFGPNHYKTLRSYHKGFERVINLGRSVFRFVNKFMIIPMFNWFGNWISSVGIIILIMTILIKVVLFPLTYRSYLSTAKMRVLKPQIDELSKKYPQGKEAEKQQAVMALYRRAGVNPMGGCLPVLLQMPILIALFRFFPASIELRQQSFLWAHDLSTYDSVLNLPFNIPMYGDHVSLFTLLMAISMIVSTKLNNANQSVGQNQATMKMMMWFMPIMLLVMFNSYSSGLSYYYLLANIITIAQTWIIRKYIVDEESVLAKLEANKKKAPKKSKWQQRMEEAQKARGMKPRR